MSDSPSDVDSVIDQIKSSDRFSERVEEIAEHFHDSGYKDERIPEIKTSFREDVEEAGLSEGEAKGVAGRLIGTLMQRAGEKAPPKPAERLPAGDGPIPEARYEELPGPLVRLLRLIEAEENPFRQAHRLIDAIEWAVKWHTTLALGDLLSGTDLPAEVKVLLAHGLRTPSLGLWNKFFREALGALENPALPWGSWERLTALESKHKLVNFRNEYAHGATPPPEECQEAVENYLPVLKEMVHTPIFTDVGLAIRGEGADPQLLRGSERQAVDIEIEEGRPTALLPNLEVEAPGETPWTEREHLDLWPLGLAATASVEDAGGSEDEERPQFFYFNALKNEAVERLNYEEALLDRAPGLYDPFHKRLPLRQWREAKSPELRPFRARTEALTEDFVGRREERERLRSFATDGKGTLMVFGAPGIGKSALLAQVKREIEAGVDLDGQDLSDEMPPVIEYFIRSGKSDDAVQFLRHLCRRLDNRYGLDEQGLGSEPVELNEQLRARLQAIEDEARANSEDGSGQPERTLLLIDGLDEGPELGRYIPESRPWLPVLVASRKTEKARSFYENRAIETREEMTVGPLSTEDIRALLYQRMNKYDPDLTEEYVQAIAERSEGNPLYLQLLAEQLFQGELALGDIEALPDRIGELYAETVQRVTDGGENRMAENALLLLAVAREPLSTGAMADLLDERGSRVRSGLRAAMELLQRQDGDGNEPDRYQLFHETLRGWLRDKHSQACEELGEQVAERCLAWAERREDGARGYALRHAAAHLKAASRSEALYELLTDEDYQDAQVRATGQFDATYRAYEHGLESYVERDGEAPEDDARLCRLALDAGKAAQEAKEGVTQAFRWAEDGRMDDALLRIEVLAEEKYFLAALRLLWIEADRQAEKPEKERSVEEAQKVLDAVEERIAPGTEAIDWSEFVDEDFMAWWVSHVLSCLPSLDTTPLLLRIRSSHSFGFSPLPTFLEALVSRLAVEKEEPEVLGRLAIRVAHSLEDTDKFAETLANIASALATAGDAEEARSAYDKALDAARSIGADDNRAIILMKVASALVQAESPEQAYSILEEALSIARTINSEGARQKILVSAAPRLAIAGRGKQTNPALEKTLGSIRAIESEENRAEALSSVAPDLAVVGKFDRAIATARSIEPEKNRAEALESIASALADTEEFDQALRAARKIEIDETRSKAFTEVASSLAESERFDDSLHIAQSVGDEEHRAEAFSSIAKALVQAGNTEKARSACNEVLDAAQVIESNMERAQALTEAASILASAGYFDQARASCDEALDAARAIDSDKSQAGALTEVASTLVETGNSGQARSVFEDAFLIIKRLDAEYNDGIPLGAFTRFLIENGNLGWALEVAQSIDPDNALTSDNTRTSALVDVASAFAEAGEPDQALNAACAIKSNDERAKTLSSVAYTLADAESMEEASSAFEDCFAVSESSAISSHRAELLTSIISPFLNNGNFDRAFSVASVIDHQGDRADAFRSVAAALVDADTQQKADSAFEEALESARGIASNSGRAETLADVGSTLSRSDNPKQADSTLEEAIDAAQAIDSNNGSAEALTYVASSLADIGNLEDAHSCFEEAFDIVEDPSNLDGVISALADADDSLQTAHILERIADSARAIELDHDRASTLAATASALAESGAPEMARSLLKEAHSAAVEPDSNVLRVGALVNVASVLDDIRNFEEAYSAFEEALDAASAIDSDAGRGHAFPHIASTLPGTGDPERIASLYEQILDAACELDQKYRGEILADIAAAVTDFESLEQSAPLLERILDAAQEIDNETHRAWGLAGVASALADSGHPEKARPVYKEALTTALSIEDLSNRASRVKRVAKQQAKSGWAEAFAEHLPDLELAHDGWTDLLSTWREALLEHDEDPRPLLRHSFTLYPFDAEAASEGVYSLIQAHIQAGAMNHAEAVAKACPELELGVLVSEPELPLPEGCDPDALSGPHQQQFEDLVESYEEGDLDDSTFEAKAEMIFEMAEM